MKYSTLVIWIVSTVVTLAIGWTKMQDQIASQQQTIRHQQQAIEDLRHVVVSEFPTYTAAIYYRKDD